MSSPQSQQWEAYHGEDISIVLTGADNTNPTAYALAFTLKLDPNSTGTADLTISSGFTIGGSGPYTITIPITRAQSGTTLTQDKYVGDLWRTDSGSNKRLAAGTLTLLDPVRAPA